MRQVLVIGSSGILGRAIVSHLRSLSHSCITVDIAPSPDSLEVPQYLLPGSSLSAQSNHLLSSLPSKGPLGAIICAAGGWVGGKAGDKDFPSSIDTMNVFLQPSLLAAHLACSPGTLGSDGFLILTGSAAALSPTPTMVAYGLAKSATHSLTRFLGASGSGMPPGAHSLALAPHVIDTPNNRKWMSSGADTSSWTPPSHIARRVGDLIGGNVPSPPSGSILECITTGGVTDWVTHAP